MSFAPINRLGGKKQKQKQDDTAFEVTMGKRPKGITQIASHLIGKSFKHPYGEFTEEKLKSTTNNQLTTLQWTILKWILQPQSSLWMTAAQDNGLITVSWEPLSLNYPAEPFPNSWPTDTVWDNIFCCSKKEMSLSCSLNSWPQPSALYQVCSTL